jgi:nucleotide-binding universal stress UspA family protein
LFWQENIMPQELVSSSGPKKVLLPIDFRSSSEAALAMGTALARSFGAELHILHVIPMLPVINGVDDFPQMEPAFEINFMNESRRRAEQSMAKCVGQLVDQGVKASSTTEIDNDVVDIILAAITNQHIALLTISTHGISRRRPLAFGSIAEKLIRLVQCPLMVLRSLEPLVSLPA